MGFFFWWFQKEKTNLMVLFFLLIGDLIIEEIFSMADCQEVTSTFQDDETLKTYQVTHCKYALRPKEVLVWDFFNDEIANKDEVIFWEDMPKESPKTSFCCSRTAHYETDARPYEKPKPKEGCPCCTIPEPEIVSHAIYHNPKVKYPIGKFKLNNYKEEREYTHVIKRWYEPDMLHKRYMYWDDKDPFYPLCDFEVDVITSYDENFHIRPHKQEPVLDLSKCQYKDGKY